MKIPMKQVKPLVCMLWPLAISDEPDPAIDVDLYAYDFHCNNKQPPKSAKLSEPIRETLEHIWGDGIVKEIESKAK
jgi:hypothetical protein